MDFVSWVLQRLDSLNPTTDAKPALVWPPPIDINRLDTRRRSTQRLESVVQSQKNRHAATSPRPAA